MKKKATRVASLVMAGIATFGFANLGVACKKDNGVVIDKTKTQLYVSNLDLGIGRTWIESTGEQFEKDFAEYSFEEGKKGVQVLYDHTLVHGGTLLSGMENSQAQVFFTEALDYLVAANGPTLPITDIISQPAITGVDANGEFTKETVNISTKVNSQMLDFLKHNGEYYALPYYLAVKGIIGDMDLWNEKGFFFAKGGCPSESIVQAMQNGTGVNEAVAAYDASTISIDDCVFVNANGEYNGVKLGLSAGPDGKYDTYDDGLPATFQEFYVLMDYMSARQSTIPMVWAGTTTYHSMLTNAVMFKHMGAEQLNLMYSLNGTAKDLVVFNGDGSIKKGANGIPETEDVSITDANSYEIRRNAGAYYALQLSEKVAQSSDWTDDAVCYGGALNHIATQSKYLTSVNTSGQKRIAMLIEGGWWQQESTQTFEIMEQQNSKYSKANRNFKIIPTPWANGAVFAEKVAQNAKDISFFTNNSFCFLNGNLKEGTAARKVAETFFSYAHSDKIMSLFTEKTSIVRALNYKVDETTLSKVGPYTKNYVEYVTEYSDIVYPYSGSTTFKTKFSYFDTSGTSLFQTQVAGIGDFSYPIASFNNSTYVSQGLTPDKWFKGLYEYRRNSWA